MGATLRIDHIIPLRSHWLVEEGGYYITPWIQFLLDHTFVFEHNLYRHKEPPSPKKKNILQENFVVRFHNNLAAECRWEIIHRVWGSHGFVHILLKAPFLYPPETSIISALSTQKKLLISPASKRIKQLLYAYTQGLHNKDLWYMIFLSKSIINAAYMRRTFENSLWGGPFLSSPDQI